MKKIILIGNVTKDAELKDVNGRWAINFNVAVNENYKDKEGKKVEKTSFFSCAIWRDKTQSTELSKYLLKGTKVHLEGSPSAVIYVNKERVSCIDYRVVVSELILLSSAKKETSENETTANNNEPTFSGNGSSTDDLPF